LLALLGHNPKQPPFGKDDVIQQEEDAWRRESGSAFFGHLITPLTLRAPTRRPSRRPAAPHHSLFVYIPDIIIE
jgi:hypothetical protein